jgi:hypothetical protein
MGNTNKNNAATDVAALTKVYNEALEAQKAVAEDATDEVKSEAQVKVDEAKAALDSASTPKETSGKTKKVKFLLSPTGKFNLAYNVGETGTLPANQADEVVAAKYAEFVK